MMLNYPKIFCRLKPYYQDWRFWFKLGFGLLIMGTLFYSWMYPLFNGIDVPDSQKKNAANWIWYTQDKGDYTLNLLSFFTIQTNIFIGLWFFFGALFHSQEGKSSSRWFNQYITLAVTVYIAITGLIYNTMLLPTQTISGFFAWYTNVIEHMLVPVVAVAYFLLFMKREKKSLISNKELIQKRVWWTFIYPVTWIIVMLIRGEFRYQSGKAWAYQYFFINIHESFLGIPGVAWLFIAILLVAGLILGLSVLFNRITSKRTKNLF